MSLTSTIPVSVEGILRRSRIPELHLQHQHAWGEHAKYDAAMTHLSSAISREKLCVLIGGRGTGKTQMVALYARRLAELWSGMQAEDTPIVYRTAKEMLAEIRIGINETGQMPDRFVKARLLIVDEIQVRSETEDQRDNLTLLIDKRYGAMKATVLIGNLKQDELQAALGASICDRVRDGGCVIPFTWQSFRGVAS